jgi:hypothetical protein
MNNKLLISASALVLGVAMAGSALAEADSTAAAGLYSTANSSAIHNGDDNSSVTKSTNLSSAQEANISINASESSTKVDDSGNETNRSDTSSKTTDSYNNTNKSSTEETNTSVTKTDTKVDIDDSYNDKSGSWNQTYNTQVTVKAALSLQILENSVSGVAVKFGDGDGGDGGVGYYGPGGAGASGTANLSSNLSTGSVTSSGSNDFSGIQTANYDTGFGAAVQGATGLAATSSISFADGNN